MSAGYEYVLRNSVVSTRSRVVRTDTASKLLTYPLQVRVVIKGLLVGERKVVLSHENQHQGLWVEGCCTPRLVR